MKLNVSGNINQYYVQTLCMIFFPGSTFGENEVSGDGIPEVSVELSELGDGGYTAEVSMKLNDKVCTYSSTVLATAFLTALVPNIATLETMLRICVLGFPSIER